VTSGVIGRDEELAAVRAFVTSVSDGPAGLVIEGEAGIGKTTLWRPGVDAARERSYRVLTATPTAAEAALPTSLQDVRHRHRRCRAGRHAAGGRPWNG
jgi:Cdc6-like AAA superfamily ATPase